MGLLIKSLFGDVLVAEAVVFCVRSLQREMNNFGELANANDGD